MEPWHLSEAMLGVTPQVWFNESKVYFSLLLYVHLGSVRSLLHRVAQEHRLKRLYILGIDLGNHDLWHDQLKRRRAWRKHRAYSCLGLEVTLPTSAHSQLFKSGPRQTAREAGKPRGVHVYLQALSLLLLLTGILWNPSYIIVQTVFECNLYMAVCWSVLIDICWDLFIFKNFIYLWLLRVFGAVWSFSSCVEWELLSRCGAQASHCDGFPCCRA